MKTNIRNLDRNLLLTLDALYDERNVTRAAERLALTQPTVSGMLKRLRELFDDALYVRTSHGVVPTPRAEALAQPVKDSIASAHSLLVDVEFNPATSDFEVKLCGSDYTHNTLLGPLAGEILRHAPAARISLLSQPAANADALLASGCIDMLFSTHDLATPEVPGVALYQDTLVCMSSYRAHADGQDISLEELCALRHVILTPVGAPISKSINTALAKRNLRRKIAISVPNFAAVFQAMSHIELVAFLPGQMAYLYADQFKRLNVDLETPTTKVVARWHPRTNNDARHLWIREKLEETVSKLNVLRFPFDQPHRFSSPL